MKYRIVFLTLVVWFQIAKTQQTILQNIDSLEKIISTTDNEALKLSCLNKIAFAYHQYDPNKGLEFAKKAEELALKLDNKEQLTQAYNGIGTNYIMLAQNEQGISFFEKAGQLNLEIGNKKGYAQNIGNIGQVKYYAGDYDGALDYLIRSLQIMEELDDTLGIAIQAGGIANIYHIQKNYEKALHYDSFALEEYRQIKDNDGIALTLGNMANRFTDLGQQENALKNYQEALSMYRQLGSKPGMARNLINMATIYNAKKNFQKAAILLNEAKGYYLTLNDKRGYAMTLGNLGTSYRRSYAEFGNRDTGITIIPESKSILLNQAELYYKSAVDILNEIGELTSLDAWSRELSLVYDEKGDYENSLKYFKIYSQTKDSIYSNESKIMIEKLTTEREVGLKNKQIEINRLEVLKKRNERIYFIIAIGLLAIASLFIYRNYSNQKMANAELAVLNDQIRETNNQLEDKNITLNTTLKDLKETQDQLIETERQKENAVIRSRISQDIHDDISSGLTKISWLAEMVKAKSATGNISSDLSLIDKINGYSRETVSKLGEIIWSTNPERDNLESLLAYMRNYITNYLEDSSFQYEVQFPDHVAGFTMNPELRRNLFLVLKESLNNAVKYSAATKITIVFQIDKDRYKLMVCDNGKGLEAGVIQGGGQGMINMRKRMQAIHGTMKMESSPAKGTNIIFEGRIFN